MSGSSPSSVLRAALRPSQSLLLPPTSLLRTARPPKTFPSPPSKEVGGILPEDAVVFLDEEEEDDDEAAVEEEDDEEAAVEEEEEEDSGFFFLRNAATAAAADAADEDDDDDDGPGTFSSTELEDEEFLTFVKVFFCKRVRKIIHNIKFYLRVHSQIKWFWGFSRDIIFCLFCRSFPLNSSFGRRKWRKNVRRRKNQVDFVPGSGFPHSSSFSPSSRRPTTPPRRLTTRGVVIRRGVAAIIFLNQTICDFSFLRN